MKITKLADLKLDTKNANKGTELGRKMLKASLDELGAGRSILVDRNDISVMQGALKRFAELERLEYLEDQFMRKAHVVHQFYLKERDMPVFYIDNFRDSDRFRVTAYAGDNSEAWEPRWARLLSLLKSELGPHAVTQ